MTKPTPEDVPLVERWYCGTCGNDTITQPRERLLGGWVRGICDWCHALAIGSVTPPTLTPPDQPKRRKK